MPFEPNNKPTSKLAKYLLENEKKEFETNKELIAWSTANSKKIDERIEKMLVNNFEIEKIKQKLEKDNDSFNKSYFNFNKKDLNKRIEKVQKSMDKKKIHVKSKGIYAKIKTQKQKSEKFFDQKYEEKKKRMEEKTKLENQKLKGFFTVDTNILKQIRKEFLQIIDKHIKSPH